MRQLFLILKTTVLLTEILSSSSASICTSRRNSPYFFFLLDVLPKVHCTWLSILFFMPLEMPLALACFYKPLHLRQQAPHKKPDDSCLVIEDNHQNQCRRRDHRWSAEKPTTSIYGRGHYNRWPWLQHYLAWLYMINMGVLLQFIFFPFGNTKCSHYLAWLYMIIECWSGSLCT